MRALIVIVTVIAGFSGPAFAARSPVVLTYEHVLRQVGFASDPRLPTSVASLERALIQRGSAITAHTGRQALQISFRARSAALALIVGTVLATQDTGVEIGEQFSRYLSGTTQPDVEPSEAQFTTSCTTIGQATLCRTQSGDRIIQIRREFAYDQSGGIHPPGYAPYLYTDTGSLEWDSRLPSEHRFVELERVETGSTRVVTYHHGYGTTDPIPDRLRLPVAAPVTSPNFPTPEEAGSALLDSGLLTPSDHLPLTELRSLADVARSILPTGSLPLPRVIPDATLADLVIPSADLLQPVPTEPTEGDPTSVPTTEPGTDGPDWTDPNVATPVVTEAGSLLAPFDAITESLDPFRGLTVPLSGHCTPITLDVGWWPTVPSTEAHCQLVEQHRALIYMLATLIWSLAAARIILDA